MHATFLALWLIAGQVATDSPKVIDPRLKLELFAEAPQIVTPVGIVVDSKGRVFCIESHTHFPPPNYAGPTADRIQVFEDTDGDGRADRVTTFAEGLKHTMGIGLYPDGSLYVATRSEIIRLRDTDGDGRADERKRIAYLETKGDYPHNGLSGFAFDATGQVFFGFGENLGADYKLIGSDGTALAGGGEGGNIYCCGPNGDKVRRVATGFWNPFHLCFDAYGRLFAVDNDPDSRPPCRLLHIVDGGDYGYRFRNGRRGTHPFTSWNGELPGTLPMVAGTGEAPSGVLSYESHHLPVDYRGDLLVTSWGDHRIERYKLQQRGASFTAELQPVIVGGENFRPVGIATAPDGSLYFSDWVDKSYTLHSKGRLWRLSAIKPNENKPTSFGAIAESLELRKANAIRAGKETGATELLAALDADDPFAQQAARLALLSNSKLLAELPWPKTISSKQAANIALLMREQNKTERLSEFLASSDPRVCFVAIQWIGEERLTSYRDSLAKVLERDEITRQVFEATLAALERLDGSSRKPTDEWRGEDYVLPILLNEKTSANVKRLALRSLRPDHPKLTLVVYQQLLNAADESLSVEVIRSLRESPHGERLGLLKEIANDPKRTERVRAEAVIGMSVGSAEDRESLLTLACEGPMLIAAEALRSLRSEMLNEKQTKRLAAASERQKGGTWKELVARIGVAVAPDAPATTDIAAWMQRAGETGDAQNGQRLFFNPRAAACFRCHEHEGRGANVGPDLSSIHRSATRQRLVESIVQPSREIAPHFVPWQIETTDGRTFTGMYIGQEVDGTHRYIDSVGKEFRLKIADMEQRVPSPKSIMPDGLPTQLTAQEFRDLLAFLLRQ